MKALMIIFMLLVASLSAQAQADSSYVRPGYENPVLLRDSLNSERLLFIQTGGENTLLRKQNERAISGVARFWGVVLLLAASVVASSLK